MAKLNECQFIEIKIDNTAVGGSSEEQSYKGWMEGYVPAGIVTIAGPDGAYFDTVHASILVTKESSKLYEKYLQRGYRGRLLSFPATTAYGACGHSRQHHPPRMVAQHLAGRTGTADAEVTARQQQYQSV